MHRPASRLRTFGYTFAVGLAIGAALVVLHLVFHWPTSDYRVRLYILLWSAPLTFGAGYALALFAAGAVATRLIGWRGRVALLGAAAAALLVLGALYSGIFSWAVWHRPPEVTTAGRAVRVGVALLTIGVALVVGWRGARSAADRRLIPTRAT